MVKQCHLVDKMEVTTHILWVNKVSRSGLFRRKNSQVRSLTHLSAFVSNQGSEGLGVEAAVAEAQAPVHAVGCQLQGLLTDVVLMENQIVVSLTRVAPTPSKHFGTGRTSTLPRTFMLPCVPAGRRLG